MNSKEDKHIQNGKKFVVNKFEFILDMIKCDLYTTIEFSEKINGEIIIKLKR